MNEEFVNQRSHENEGNDLPKCFDSSIPEKKKAIHSHHNFPVHSPDLSAQKRRPGLGHLLCPSVASLSPLLRSHNWFHSDILNINIKGKKKGKNADTFPRIVIDFVALPP